MSVVPNRHSLSGCLCVWYETDDTCDLTHPPDPSLLPLPPGANRVASRVIVTAELKPYTNPHKHKQRTENRERYTYTHTRTPTRISQTPHSPFQFERLQHPTMSHPLYNRRHASTETETGVGGRWQRQRQRTHAHTGHGTQDTLLPLRDSSHRRTASTYTCDTSRRESSRCPTARTSRSN